MIRPEARRSRLVLIFPILLMFFAGSVDEAVPAENSGLRPFPQKGFIPAQVCGGCHGELADMWSGTLHARAFDDSLFRAASKLFVTQVAGDPERVDAEHCVACHNPIAYRSGRISGSSSDYSATDDFTVSAISCDLCHTVNEIVETRNAAFNTDPGDGSRPGVKRGPWSDAEPMYHQAAFSELHVSAEFCGSCHNVTHLSYGTKLEDTYDEWQAGPYNSTIPAQAVPCQDCHMRQTKGNPSTGMTVRPDYPGKATPLSKERLNIYPHHFSGANAFMPRLLGNEEEAGLAVERLEHAAVLEILEGEPSGGQTGFTVRVRNEGAGHMLPTGVTEYRQMWLEITVTGPRGEKVFSSGILGDDGSLSSDARLFNTVLGDAAGKPTMNVSQAVTVLSDRRIPPKGFVDERFLIPGALQRPYTLRAALKYRSLDPSVARLLLGNLTMEIPVITMASVEKQLP